MVYDSRLDLLSYIGHICSKMATYCHISDINVQVWQPNIIYQTYMLNYGNRLGIYAQIWQTTVIYQAYAQVWQPTFIY